jgi:hypothetical protein
MSTPKIRFRAENRLFRKPLLVLQVSSVCNTGYDDETTPHSKQGIDYLFWEDATVEGLLNLNVNLGEES